MNRFRTDRIRCRALTQPPKFSLERDGSPSGGRLNVATRSIANSQHGSE